MNPTPLAPSDPATLEGLNPDPGGISYVILVKPITDVLKNPRKATVDAENSMIDEFDHKILALLERDGALTSAALADKVGLSASACHRRVKLLEAEGVIEGYAAILSDKALGRGATIFVALKGTRLKQPRQIRTCDIDREFCSPSTAPSWQAKQRS